MTLKSYLKRSFHYYARKFICSFRINTINAHFFIIQGILFRSIRICALCGVFFWLGPECNFHRSRREGFLFLVAGEANIDYLFVNQVP